MAVGAATRGRGEEELPEQRSGRKPPTLSGPIAAVTGEATAPAATVLVGRDDDLLRLSEKLGQHRLVTLTGPGGVGKTSLALAAVRQPVPGPPAVVVCELAEVESAAAVRHAVAARLQVRPPPGVPLGPALASTRDDAQLLVVLDSCEHVLDAAAEVAEELLAAAHVRVLATSREPLHLEGECVLALRPLTVPDSPEDADAPRAPAVVLFARRAALADTGFRLDEQTLPDVVRICRALDGIPLALEIAAARVRALAVRDIAERLSQPFRLLRRTAGRRTPDRHRSVRAVVDWSYALLGPSERELLTTMAVYPGGFDLAAATAAGAAAAIEEADVLDLLDGLVAKSLMTLTSVEGRTRYGMLETVRAYGIERLEESGRLGLARDRHADHYAELSRRVWAAALHAWTEELSALTREFDNVRAAVTRTLAADPSPDRTFDLVAPMCYVGLQHSAEEIAELADRALERWPDPRHPRWSEVAATAAGALYAVEDFARARSRARAAVEAYSSAAGAALAWCALAGISGSVDDDPVAGLQHLDRADAAAVAAGFEPFRCDLLALRAELLAQAGRREDAVAAAEQALAMSTDQGNAYTRAGSLQLLGMLHVLTQPAAAREWLEAALAEALAVGYPYVVSASQRGLAVLAAEEGDLVRSAELFSEALRSILRSGFLAERWHTVAALAPLLIQAGRRDSAATLLAGARSAGAVISRLHVPTIDDTREELARDLDSAGTSARGRALSPDQLVLLARQELQRISQGTRAEQPSGAPPGAPAELRRVGDLWHITFAGSSVHLPNSKGVADLAVLLARPGREVAALDLASPPAVVPRSRSAAEAAAAPVAGFGAPGDLGERLDEQARAAYTARIRELQADLDEADAAGDVDGGARAQHELDFLTRELSAAYGLGRPRRSGDPAERARLAVTMRLRATLAKIRQVHPALGVHLQQSVFTGRFCSYRPAEPVTWHVVT